MIMTSLCWPLNANAKAYKLAWSINSELKINLAKKSNIEINFTAGKNLNIV